MSSPSLAATAVGLVFVIGLAGYEYSSPGSDLGMAEADRLKACRQDIALRREFNHSIAADLAAGRIGLRDAAVRTWEANHDDAGYRHAVEIGYTGPTTEARAAALVVRIVDSDMSSQPTRRRVVLRRLAHDYRTTYGVPLRLPHDLAIETVQWSERGAPRGEQPASETNAGSGK